jgi:hypothetical protein
LNARDVRLIATAPDGELGLAAVTGSALRLWQRHGHLRPVGEIHTVAGFDMDRTKLGNLLKKHLTKPARHGMDRTNLGILSDFTSFVHLHGVLPSPSSLNLGIDLHTFTCLYLKHELLTNNLISDHLMFLSKFNNNMKNKKPDAKN